MLWSSVLQTEVGLPNFAKKLHVFYQMEFMVSTIDFDSTIYMPDDALSITGIYAEDIAVRSSEVHVKSGVPQGTVL